MEKMQNKINQGLKESEDYNLMKEPEKKDIVDFVNERFRRMEFSKQTISKKIDRCDILFNRGMNAVHVKNIYSSRYLSQRFFSAVQAWVDDWVENNPQTTLKASEWRDRSANQKAKGIAKALDIIDNKGFAQNERVRAFEDAAKYGTGVILDQYDEGRQEMTTHRIDVRDFFIDDAATSYYGGTEVGSGDARDVIYRQRIPFTTFKEKFGNRKGYDIEGVAPVIASISNGDLSPLFSNLSTTERDEGKDLVKVVVIKHYFNVESGKRYMVAGDKLINEQEMQTSILPFIVYNFQKQGNSPWGIGVIELMCSAVNANDTLMQLTLMGAKNDLQPVLVVDEQSGISSNKKVQPGGVLTLKNPGQKKMSDVFATIKLGTEPGKYFDFKNMLDDEQTIATQKDPRSLFINPNQLATTTLAKKEAFAKRTRTILQRTLWTSEKLRGMVRVELFKKFIAPKGKDFFIEGSFVLRGDTESPKFIDDNLGSGTYRATKNNTDVDVEVYVEAKKEKSNSDEQEIGQKLQFLQVVSNQISIMPELKDEFNMKELISSVGEAMIDDFSKVLKQTAKKGTDAVEEIHKRILLGVSTPTPKDETFQDTIERIDSHKSFLKANINNLSLQQKIKITDIITKAYEDIDKAGKLEEKGSQQVQQAPVNGEIKKMAGASPQLKTPLSSTTNQAL